MRIIRMRIFYYGGKTMKFKKNASTPLRKLVECAILVAMAVILNFFKINSFWALGGSITVVSMLPILLAGYRHGIKWGTMTGLAYATLQILLDIAQISSWGLTPIIFIGTLLFDYLLAYGGLSLAGLFHGKKNGLWISSVVCLTWRYAMHFLSGVILFAEYDQPGFTPITWSLAYNGSYMVPEIILTTAVAFLISRIPSVAEKIRNE
jgi:thiamine transporter